MNYFDQFNLKMKKLDELGKETESLSKAISSELSHCRLSTKNVSRAVHEVSDLHFDHEKPAAMQICTEASDVIENRRIHPH